MVHRPGDLEPYQLQEAATALAKARARAEIAALVDKLAALGAPKLYSELRAQYESFRQRRHPFLQNMRGPCGALFHELHLRICQDDARSARAAGRPQVRIPVKLAICSGDVGHHPERSDAGCF